MFHCTLFSSLTCSVHQHLPQLLLITGMDEVKHTVSRQVKLQWKEIYKYIFAVMHTANHLNPNVTKILSIFCALNFLHPTPLSHRFYALSFIISSTQKQSKSDLPVPAQGTC